jgi:hypothetical protein
MAERRMTHKGHSIVIHDDPDALAVTIDGQPVQVSATEAGYWTPHRAYRDFDSLDELARAVAEITRQPE